MLLLSGLHGGSAPTLLRTCDANRTDRVVLFLLIDWFVTESTTTHSDMPPRKACGSDYTKPVIAVTVAASVFFAATPAVVCDTRQQGQRTQTKLCMMYVREHRREDATAAAPYARTVARYFPPEQGIAPSLRVPPGSHKAGQTSLMSSGFCMFAH